MKRTRFALLVVPVLLLALVMSVQAQQVEPAATAEVDPNANITWPPPVYVLRGEFTVRGSANLPNMLGYFIEYRRLNDDLTVIDENAPWVPGTLLSGAPVLNDVLGVWNTTTTQDGIYELRLTINIQGGQPVNFRVAPLRVENNPPPFAITPTVAPQVVLPTIAPQTTQSVPTLMPTPTAFDTTPRVTSTVNANVRSGDSTAFPFVSSLQPGVSANILGISSTGSGWYYIELPDGKRGWIAGSIVTVTGDISSVPRIAPPPPPATATPIATATPTLPDAVITGVRYDRGQIKQGEGFQIIVRARNNSGVFQPDTVVLCTVKPQSGNNVETSGNVGSLNGFEERDVFLPFITVNSGGGNNVTVDCAIDVNNLVAETNDGNNFFSISTPLLAP